MAAPKKKASAPKAKDKNANDARKRASERGTPVGETSTADYGNPFKSSPNTNLKSYTTVVKSNRGNMYKIIETKGINKMSPDKRSTRIVPVTPPKKKKK